MDGFEQREIIAEQGYWKDKRWKEVRRLRSQKKHTEANNLVFKIRTDRGIN